MQPSKISFSTALNHSKMTCSCFSVLTLKHSQLILKDFQSIQYLKSQWLSMTLKDISPFSVIGTIEITRFPEPTTIYTEGQVPNSFSFSFVQLQLQIHLEWNLVKSLLGWALVDLNFISIWQICQDWICWVRKSQGEKKRRRKEMKNCKELCHT